MVGANANVCGLKDDKTLRTLTEVVYLCALWLVCLGHVIAKE